jgi:glutamine amidotransferase
MCRLVAVVASEVTEFGLVLKDAPRSLARLSRDHPDGWGIASYGGAPRSVTASAESAADHEGWHIDKGTARADQCDIFAATATRSSGTVLVAHVRKKTVGPTALANTHPFVQDGWVFAHNGTLGDLAYVRSGASAARLGQVRGDTDSEALFAFFLTRLDAAGVTGEDSPAARERATAILAEASEELRARGVGAFNYLLARAFSSGESCFVHRSGRTLFFLERTHLQRRDRVVLVASEKLTDEPWVQVPEGSFLRLDRRPMPAVAWWGQSRAAS